VRTTLTIEDDVAALLEAEQRRSGASFKETVNRALRKGLLTAEPPKRERFKVTPITGTRLHEIWKSDSVAELLELLDGPEHR
jgi:hypothetical protein